MAHLAKKVPDPWSYHRLESIAKLPPCRPVSRGAFRDSMTQDFLCLPKFCCTQKHVLNMKIKILPSQPKL